MRCESDGRNSEAALRVAQGLVQGQDNNDGCWTDTLEYNSKRLTRSVIE